MKYMKMIGLALLAVCAITAVATATASAALPEFSKTGATVTGEAVGGTTFETKGGTKVACTGGSTSTGKIASEKTITGMKIAFTGCKSSGFACTTEKAKEGELITNAVVGKLGYINSAKKEVGLLIAPEKEGGNFFTFNCVGSLIKVVFTGSVICPITPINTLTKEKKWVCKQTKGVQSVTKFEGGPEDFHKIAINGGAAEQAALEGTFIIKTSVALEIKA
jgi:hypothetical protein